LGVRLLSRDLAPKRWLRREAFANSRIPSFRKTTSARSGSRMTAGFAVGAPVEVGDQLRGKWVKLVTGEPFGRPAIQRGDHRPRDSAKTKAGIPDDLSNLFAICIPKEASPGTMGVRPQTSAIMQA